MQTALRHHHLPMWPLAGRLLRLTGIVVLAVLSLALLWSWLPNAEERVVTPAVAANQLVHWRDAGHDWLLVIDPATRELVIYDANDGRPLQRLGADDGMPEVRAIRQQGALLLVTAEKQPEVRRFRLPELQAAVANDR